MPTNLTPSLSLFQITSSDVKFTLIFRNASSTQQHLKTGRFALTLQHIYLGHRPTYSTQTHILFRM